MVISPELRAQIKQLEISTKRLLNSAHVGDFRRTVKGSGFDFESLREYVPGDDIRFIDWRATARSDTLLVRQYYEERSRTIMIMLDGSASTIYGIDQARFERMREVAAVLALACLCTKDSVGLIIFSDDVAVHMPPVRSSEKVHKLIETMYSYKPHGKTGFRQVFKKLSVLPTKDTLSCVISDFIAHDYQQPLRVFARRSDVIAFRCIDEVERQFPFGGVIELEDPETQERLMVDMRAGSSLSQDFCAQWHREVLAQLQNLSIDVLEIDLNKPYIANLIRFFRRRLMYC